MPSRVTGHSCGFPGAAGADEELPALGAQSRGKKTAFGMEKHVEKMIEKCFVSPFYGDVPHFIESNYCNITVLLFQ